MRGAVLVVIGATVLAACGGGEKSPDPNEASGTFEVELTRADFAERQSVSGSTDLVLALRNTGDEAIPQLAVTIWTGRGGAEASKPQGSFNLRDDGPDRASRTLPVWVPAPGYPKLLEGNVTAENADAAPSAGAVAAQTDTYAFGALEAGESRTAVWRVTPVRPGDYTLHYAVAAGLKGNATAETASGEPAGGEFAVTITTAPRETCVVDRDQPGRCE